MQRNPPFGRPERASDSRSSRGPSVQTRPQTIRRPGKDLAPRRRGKAPSAPDRPRHIRLARRRRAVGLVVQDQDFFCRHRQPVDAAIDLGARTRIPATSARNATSAWLPGAKAAANPGSSAPASVSSASISGCSNPLACTIGHRRRAAPSGGDLRQPRQQRMHHIAAPEAVSRPQGEKHGGLRHPAHPTGGSVAAAQVRAARGRVSPGGQAFAASARGRGGAPFSSSAWPKACASSSPGVMRRAQAFGRRVRASSYQEPSRGAVLVLEAADIKPVAGAGERDIEQAAMLAQHLGFGSGLGLLHDCRRFGIGQGKQHAVLRHRADGPCGWAVRAGRWCRAGSRYRLPAPWRHAPSSPALRRGHAPCRA